MKTILITVLLLISFNLCQAQEAQKSAFRFSLKKFNASYQKSLMISSFHTFIPIGMGILLLASSNDNQTQFKTAGKLLFGSGLLLGPSIGHFYLKNAKRGYTGLLIRSIALY